MFYKFHVNHVKGFLNNSYHIGKKLLSNIDEAYTVGKSVYSSVQPLLKEFIPENTRKSIDNTLMKGVSNYENLRSRVMDIDSKVSDKLGQVKNNLNSNIKTKNLLNV